MFTTGSRKAVISRLNTSSNSKVLRNAAAFTSTKVMPSLSAPRPFSTAVAHPYQLQHQHQHLYQQRRNFGFMDDFVDPDNNRNTTGLEIPMDYGVFEALPDTNKREIFSTCVRENMA